MVPFSRSLKIASFTTALLLGTAIHQQSGSAQTGDRAYDLLINNYTRTINQQIEESRRSQECINSGRGFGCPLGPSASTSAMAMSYLVQIQNYLQAVANQTYQNPRFCGAASRYFVAAYNTPTLRGGVSQIGMVTGSGLEMFCLQYGYRTRFR